MIRGGHTLFMPPPKKYCSIEDCNAPCHGRGWCSKHYRRWHKHGDTSINLYGITLEDRFWGYVRKTKACWVWLGGTGQGYGKFAVKQNTCKTVRSHRFSYELIKGPIPKHLIIDHLCRNKLCVNPDHLEAVTCRENTMRGIGPAAINSRKTHCKRGHAFDKQNTYINKKNQRICRTCNRVRSLARYHAFTHQNSPSLVSLTWKIASRISLT